MSKHTLAVILGFLLTMSLISSVTANEKMMNSSPELGPELIELIKQAVQKDHHSPINHFKIEEVTSKNWSSSALGCPKPGMQYLQVITPGFLVHANADGIAYKVHTSKKHAVLCEQNKPDSLSHRSNKKPKLPESTLNRIKAIQISRRELIKTKGIDAKKVRLKSVNDALASELSDSCKEKYAGKPKGYRVILSHEKLTVVFFSDGKNVVRCSSKTSI